MTALGTTSTTAVGPPCGRCNVCTGTSLAVDLSPAAVEDAIRHLRSADLVIESRKQLPDRSRIPAGRRTETGRVLAVWGDGGWGGLVREGREAGGGRFDDRLVAAAADLVAQRWRPDPFPTWVAAVPSLRRPDLVPDFARRVAEALGLPCEDVLVRVRDADPQQSLHNSAQQYGNVRGTFEVPATAVVPAGPVLLVDDLVDYPVDDHRHRLELLRGPGRGPSSRWPWPTGPAPPGEIGGVPRHRPARGPVGERGAPAAEGVRVLGPAATRWARCGRCSADRSGS